MVSTGGFVNRKVDPALPQPSDIAVSNHCSTLNAFGHKVIALTLCVAVLNPSQFAVGLALAVVIAWTYYKSGDYRRHITQILETYAGWKILRLLAKAWLFWLAIGLLDALVVGLLDFQQIVYFKTVYLVGVIGILLSFVRSESH